MPGAEDVLGKHAGAAEAQHRLPDTSAADRTRLLPERTGACQRARPRARAGAHAARARRRARQRAQVCAARHGAQRGGLQAAAGRPGGGHIRRVRFPAPCPPLCCAPHVLPSPACSARRASVWRSAPRRQPPHLLSALPGTARAWPLRARTPQSALGPAGSSICIGGIGRHAAGLNSAWSQQLPSFGGAQQFGGRAGRDAGRAGSMRACSAGSCPATWPSAGTRTC